MTAKYYSGLITPVSITPQYYPDPDYPVTHLANPRLARPFRSLGVNTVRAHFDFGVSTYIEAIVLCDVNLTPDLWSGVTTTMETLLGDLVPKTNEITRRGNLAFSVAASVRYLSIRVTTGDIGSLPYANIGAAYVYSTVTALPKRPRYGFKMERQRPEIEKKLPNGVVQQLVTGTDYTKLTGSFKGTASDDIMGLLNAAQQETVFLDLDIANRPGLAWPVKLDGNTVSRTIEKHNREVTPFTLRETV